MSTASGRCRCRGCNGQERKGAGLRAPASSSFSNAARSPFLVALCSNAVLATAEPPLAGGEPGCWSAIPAQLTDTFAEDFSNGSTEEPARSKANARDVQ